MTNQEGKRIWTGEMPVRSAGCTSVPIQPIRLNFPVEFSVHKDQHPATISK